MVFFIFQATNMVFSSQEIQKHLDVIKNPSSTPAQIAQSAGFLGENKAKEAIPFLVPLLASPDAGIYTPAANAIYAMGKDTLISAGYNIDTLAKTLKQNNFRANHSDNLVYAGFNWAETLTAFKKAGYSCENIAKELKPDHNETDIITALTDAGFTPMEILGPIAKNNFSPNTIAKFLESNNLSVSNLTKALKDSNLPAKEIAQALVDLWYPKDKVQEYLEAFGDFDAATAKAAVGGVTNIAEIEEKQRHEQRMAEINAGASAGGSAQLSFTHLILTEEKMNAFGVTEEISTLLQEKAANLDSDKVREGAQLALFYLFNAGLLGNKAGGQKFKDFVNSTESLEGNQQQLFIELAALFAIKGGTVATRVCNESIFNGLEGSPAEKISAALGKIYTKEGDSITSSIAALPEHSRGNNIFWTGILSGLRGNFEIQEVKLSIVDAVRNDDLAGVQAGIADATQKQKDAALHWACARNNSVIVAFLLDNGANIEVKDGNGNTPLIKAAAGPSPLAVELLLERGADRQATNNAGETALALAEKELKFIRDNLAELQANDATVQKTIENLQNLIRNYEKVIGRLKAETIAEPGLAARENLYQGLTPLSPEESARQGQILSINEHEIAKELGIAVDESTKDKEQVWMRLEEIKNNPVSRERLIQTVNAKSDKVGFLTISPEKPLLSYLAPQEQISMLYDFSKKNKRFDKLEPIAQTEYVRMLSELDLSVQKSGVFRPGVDRIAFLYAYAGLSSPTSKEIKALAESIVAQELAGTTGVKGKLEIIQEEGMLGGASGRMSEYLDIRLLNTAVAEYTGKNANGDKINFKITIADILLENARKRGTELIKEEPVQNALRERANSTLDYIKEKNSQSSQSEAAIAVHNFFAGKETSGSEQDKNLALSVEEAGRITPEIISALERVNEKNEQEFLGEVKALYANWWATKEEGDNTRTMLDVLGEAYEEIRKGDAYADYPAWELLPAPIELTITREEAEVQEFSARIGQEIATIEKPGGITTLDFIKKYSPGLEAGALSIIEAWDDEAKQAFVSALSDSPKANEAEFKAWLNETYLPSLSGGALGALEERMTVDKITSAETLKDYLKQEGVTEAQIGAKDAAYYEQAFLLVDSAPNLEEKQAALGGIIEGLKAQETEAGTTALGQITDAAGLTAWLSDKTVEAELKGRIEAAISAKAEGSERDSFVQQISDDLSMFPDEKDKWAYLRGRFNG